MTSMVDDEQTDAWEAYINDPERSAKIRATYKGEPAKPEKPTRVDRLLRQWRRLGAEDRAEFLERVKQ